MNWSKWPNLLPVCLIVFTHNRTRGFYKLVYKSTEANEGLDYFFWSMGQFHVIEHCWGFMFRTFGVRFINKRKNIFNFSSYFVHHNRF